ncbi:hypothetical protein Hanom_Chr13g01229031 [Helianthus anomalus]
MIHYFVLFGMRKKTNEWNKMTTIPLPQNKEKLLVFTKFSIKNSKYIQKFPTKIIDNHPRSAK